VHQRGARHPPHAVEQLRTVLGHREQPPADRIRLTAREGRALALGRPCRAGGRECLQRRSDCGLGRQLCQPSQHIGRAQTTLELGLRGQRLLDVPAQRGALPDRKERLDQRPALPLVHVDGRPQ
jgi:hypothetical protein